MLPQTYNRYIEPFLGSAAVFYHLKPNSAILADSNGALIDTYKAIRNDWRSVDRELKKHHRKHNKQYYYKVRDMQPRTAHTSAARFIYLNRTCWNGLYRVNQDGWFNVPIGTKTNVVLPTDDFERNARELRRARLVESDFEPIIDSATRDDLVFVDPPYTVKHNLNGFIKYNEKLFSWDDQVRLHDCLLRADAAGAKIVMTNADHRSIRQLYKGGFRISRLKRHSKLAADSSNRGVIGELLITNRD